MTSRPLKGSAAEKAAVDIWERDGFEVHRARAHILRVGPPFCPTCHQAMGRIFADSNDIWKAIDLIGMHRARGFRFGQITTISGKSGSLSYGNVSKRKLKIERLPWPPQMTMHASADGIGLLPWYTVEIWGARNQRVGRVASRWFQVWDLNVATHQWSLLPFRIPVSGPAPPGLSRPAAIDADTPVISSQN